MTDKELAKTLGLKVSELKQLQDYVEHAERDGWYYNPKEQFDKRHKNIKEALNISHQHLSHQTPRTQ